EQVGVRAADRGKLRELRTAAEEEPLVADPRAPVVPSETRVDECAAWLEHGDRRPALDIGERIEEIAEAGADDDEHGRRGQIEIRELLPGLTQRRPRAVQRDPRPVVTSHPEHRKRPARVNDDAGPRRATWWNVPHLFVRAAVEGLQVFAGHRATAAARSAPA